MRDIKLPMSKEDAKSLKLGEMVTVSGLLFTGRSRLHIRAVEDDFDFGHSGADIVAGVFAGQRVNHGRTQETFGSGAGGRLFGAGFQDVEAAFDLSPVSGMDEKHRESGIGTDQTIAFFRKVGILQTDFQMLFCHGIGFFCEGILKSLADVRRHFGRTEPDGIVHCFDDRFTLYHSYIPLLK